MEKKFNYIVVGIADEWYEEGKYLAKFDNYKDTLEYLQKNKMSTLIERLNFLEETKDTLRAYGKDDNIVDIIVSYY